MNEQQLIDTARSMVADDKGLLAMDESNPTCNKRFAKVGHPARCGDEARLSGVDCHHAHLGECISGAILV
jgi:fructose-bisphosphate aldolase class I